VPVNKTLVLPYGLVDDYQPWRWRQNIANHLSNYTASYPRRPRSQDVKYRMPRWSLPFVRDIFLWTLFNKARVHINRQVLWIFSTVLFWLKEINFSEVDYASSSCKVTCPFYRTNLRHFGVSCFYVTLETESCFKLSVSLSKIGQWRISKIRGLFGK
jgi:hypothetical protein